MVERILKGAMVMLLAAGCGPAASAQASGQTGAGQAQTGQEKSQQTLTDRATAGANVDTAVEASVVGEMRMPREASGHYDLGHGRDVMEVDFTPDGLGGYLSLFGSRVTQDAKAPLTFFFMQTRLDGDRLHFVTHEIHRTWYEFDGVLKQSPPEEKTLLVEYSLVGTLTTHRKDEKGVESQQEKKVRFKRMRY
jgi:hypothetical protein